MNYWLRLNVSCPEYAAEFDDTLRLEMLVYMPLATSNTPPQARLWRACCGACRAAGMRPGSLHDTAAKLPPPQACRWHWGPCTSLSPLPPHCHNPSAAPRSADQH